MASSATTPVEGYYLEKHDDSSNTHKFYTTIVTDNGVAVIAWGRVGTAGQSQIHKFQTRKDAEVLALKKVYAKQSEGYDLLVDKLKFVIDTDEIMRACERQNPQYLLNTFGKARTEPQFAVEQEVVLRHYDDFMAKARHLLETAADRPFDEVHAEYEELGKAWEAIDDRHALVSTTVDLVKQTMFSRLMGGSS